MRKFDVQIALEGVREANLKWSRAQREYQTKMEKVLLRLLHEAAANYMSVEEVSRYSKLTPKRVRNLMRVAGLNPRDGKTLLAKTAADALATNADLLGIAPHEMDLMSPLAYLPAGSELRQQLTDKTVSQVYDLPEERSATQLAEKLTDAGMEYDDALDWVRDIVRAAVSGNDSEVDRLRGLVTYYEDKYNEAHDRAPEAGA